MNSKVIIILAAIVVAAIAAPQGEVPAVGLPQTLPPTMPPTMPVPPPTMPNPNAGGFSTLSMNPMELARKVALDVNAIQQIGTVSGGDWARSGLAGMRDTFLAALLALMNAGKGPQG